MLSPWGGYGTGWKCAGCGLTAFDERRELVDTGAPAFAHAVEILHGVSCCRDDDGVNGDFGAAIDFAKDDGVAVGEDGFSLLVERGGEEDEALGRGDLLVLAAHGKDDAVGRAHVDADEATGAEIDLAAGVGETLRTPPLLEFVDVGQACQTRDRGARMSRVMLTSMGTVVVVELILPPW